MKDLLIGLALLSCPGIVFAVFGNSGLEAFDAGEPRTVAYSPVDEGRAAFTEECAECHGRMAEGTGLGPDLADPAYGPTQLKDQQFLNVVRTGAPARRWNFGAMPAFPDLPDRKVDRILAFVREMQRARGAL